MSVKGVVGFAALMLFSVPAAHAKGQDQVIDGVTITVSQSIHRGATPAQAAALLQGNGFGPGKYNKDFHMMSGTALFDRDGAQVKARAEAAYRITVNMDFDDRDRLTDLYVEGSRVARNRPAEDDAPSKHYTAEFGSPDGSCRILYKGHSDHGTGRFFDVSAANKRQILKEYSRVGPDVRWLSTSMAELFFSEGFPAYHSYYYDCRTRRASPSYFQSIAFDPKGKLVATLEEEAIAFYRSFDRKPFYRAKLPGLDMFDYFNCDSSARFLSSKVLHLRTQCKGRKGIDVDIKLPG